MMGEVCRVDVRGRRRVYVSQEVGLDRGTGTWQVWVMAADGNQAGPLFDTELNGQALSYAFSGERALDWVK